MRHSPLDILKTPMIDITTRDGHEHTLPTHLVTRSVVLSQLLLYPDDSTCLYIPFDLRIIEIAEQFASKDSVTKEICYNQENIHSLEYYKPVNIKHVFIKEEMTAVFNDISIEELSELINFANYLNYNILLECACSRLANILNGVSNKNLTAEDLLFQ